MPVKEVATRAASATASYVSSNWQTILRYLSVLLLLVGIFFFAKGLYSYILPPVDRVEYDVHMTFDYNASLLRTLTGSATDAVVLRSLATNPVSVTRYDRSEAPSVGFKETSWPRCSDGVVMTVVLDGTPYGPYCYVPDLLSTATFLGHFDFTAKLIVEPGPHTMKILVTYKGQPVLSQTTQFHAPTYEEVVGGESA